MKLLYYFATEETAGSEGTLVPSFCDHDVTMLIKTKTKSIKRPTPAIKITEERIEASMLLLLVSLNSS